MTVRVSPWMTKPGWSAVLPPRNPGPAPTTEGAVVRLRDSLRAVLLRLDSWTLESLNSPAGGRRPRL